MDAVKLGIKSKQFRHKWLGELLDDNNLYPFLGRYQVVEDMRSRITNKLGQYYYENHKIQEFLYRVDTGGTDDYAFLKMFYVINPDNIKIDYNPKDDDPAQIPVDLYVLQEVRGNHLSPSNINKVLLSMGANKKRCNIKFDVNSDAQVQGLIESGWSCLGKLNSKNEGAKVSKKKYKGYNFKNAMVYYGSEVISNIYIDSSCKKLIEEMPMFKRLEKDGVIVPQKFDDGNDHSVDAFLYGVLDYAEGKITKNYLSFFNNNSCNLNQIWGYQR